MPYRTVYVGDDAEGNPMYEEVWENEPDYTSPGQTDQDLANDQNVRDFLTGMSDVQATEGAGVAGTGISSMGSSGASGWQKILDNLKKMGGKAWDVASSERGMFALLLAALAARDRRKPTGGGVGTAYAGYKPIQRTIAQGKYGPYATYAAQGGLMQAYAQGGQVRPFPMQDGGFVMTGDAVKGAGGFEGLRQHIPEARPIIGPGTKTSDSIPAYIQGPRGRTPAAVSNGEAYVPPGRDTRGLYALMRSLERRA